MSLMDVCLYWWRLTFRWQARSRSQSHVIWPRGLPMGLRIWLGSGGSINCSSIAAKFWDPWEPFWLDDVALHTRLHWYVAWSLQSWIWCSCSLVSMPDCTCGPTLRASPALDQAHGLVCKLTLNHSPSYGTGKLNTTDLYHNTHGTLRLCLLEVAFPNSLCSISKLTLLPITSFRCLLIDRCIKLTVITKR